jgi:hypothetical protein
MKQQVYVSTQSQGLLEAGEFCDDTQEGLFERLAREKREKLKKEKDNNDEQDVCGLLW